MAKPKVFIGSSTECANVMTAIEMNLSSVAEMVPWNLPGAHKLGYSNLENLNNILQRCDFAILIMAGDDEITSRDVTSMTTRDNVLFELGLFMGKLGRDKVFVVQSSEVDLKVPSDFHGISVAKFEGTCRTDLSELVERLRDACNNIKLVLAKHIELGDIKDGISQVIGGVEQLKQHPQLISNILLKQVVTDSLKLVGKGFGDVDRGYALPPSQYPYHLISLQKKFKPPVKALALVDQHERFWQHESGREILETINKNSQRVFVFVNVDDFFKNFDTLVQHAAKPYKVRAMSLERLTREFYPYNRDFSIIELRDHKLLAAYDTKAAARSVRFIADPAQISDYERVFGRIFRAAVEITPGAAHAREQISKQIFGQRAVIHRAIEMSDYISIEDYDQHEEEHAYYKEMMQKMIDIFQVERSDPDELCHVLELGAGTGIFTKRLAAQENVHVGAIELDWACFKRLVYNVQKLGLQNVEYFNEDSRSYDPGGRNGKFKFIFSSFADHHIKDEDKRYYFQNVKDNLEANGSFIVGDEFLPDHERDNPESREKALEAYHNHIIALAEQSGHTALVKLEREALRSGIKELGDFKLSCKQYEKLLSSVGLAVAERHKIGPKDESNVGGVFVYRIISL